MAAVTLTRHYTLDSARRIVLQADMALGRWPVASATLPFERVTGVCTRVSRDADWGYLVRVGIRLRDGRRLWMKGFPSHDPGNSCEAGAYARQISLRTGLPIDPTPG